MKRKVVFIMGPARSGSTLLDFMLGSHPDAFSIGELIQLRKAYKLAKLSPLLKFYKRDKANPKVCTVCEGYCQFWNAK